MKTMILAAAVLTIGISSAFASDASSDGAFFKNTPATQQSRMATGHIDRSFAIPKPQNIAFENNALGG
ncbi:hypothetical protein [Rhodopila sp.]|uniref:hypothetical protein n=1 Tax=Rhodopila sp. TaxID=2480087 RepID=UPI003D12248D